MMPLCSSHHKKQWRSMVSDWTLDMWFASADHNIAGNDPMQATTAWLDRFFGMASFGLSLMGMRCL